MNAKLMKKSEYRSGISVLISFIIRNCFVSLWFQYLKIKDMTIVSSKEFVGNQKRYFDLAVNEKLFIKRGKNVFHLICTTIDSNMNAADDQDEYVTKDELLVGIHEDIDTFYANK